MTLTYRPLSALRLRFVVAVDQSFSEALKALRNIAHECGDLSPSEQQDENDNDDQNVRPAQAHSDLLAV